MSYSLFAFLSERASFGRTHITVTSHCTLTSRWNPFTHSFPLKSRPQTNNIRPKLILRFPICLSRLSVAAEPFMRGQNSPADFNLIGFDILADRAGGVWVLEANAPPCMGAQIGPVAPRTAEAASGEAAGAADGAADGAATRVHGRRAAVAQCDDLHDAYLVDLLQTFVLPYLGGSTVGSVASGSGSGSLWSQVPEAPAALRGGNADGRPLKRASVDSELQLFMRRDARCR